MSSDEDSDGPPSFLLPRPGASARLQSSQAMSTPTHVSTQGSLGSSGVFGASVGTPLTPQGGEIAPGSAGGALAKGGVDNTNEEKAFSQTFTYAEVNALIRQSALDSVRDRYFQLLAHL
jgi:hypothetical protein